MTFITVLLPAYYLTKKEQLTHQDEQAGCQHKPAKPLF